MSKNITPDHPSIRHLASPVFTPKPMRIPVSNRRISIEEARINYDGTEAQVLADGTYKRKVLKSTGRWKYEFVHPEGYVISDYSKYRRVCKAMYEILSRQDEDLRDINTVKYLPADLQENLSFRDIQRKAAVTQGEAVEEAVIIEEREPARPSISARQDELIDQAIDKAISNQEEIRMDEAFPDVGLLGADGGLVANPALRARQASVHGTRYQKEYILRTVHRLTLRRVPVDEIARMFNVSVEKVYKWIKELNDRLKQEATSLTLNHVAGDTLSFYGEIRAMGLTQASTSTKVQEKIRGLEVALRAEQDKHKFLQTAGFYDTAKLGRERQEDDAGKRAQKLITMTQSLLNGTYELSDDEDESANYEGDNLIL